MSATILDQKAKLKSANRYLACYSPQNLKSQVPKRSSLGQVLYYQGYYYQFQCQKIKLSTVEKKYFTNNFDSELFCEALKLFGYIKQPNFKTNLEFAQKYSLLDKKCSL